MYNKDVQKVARASGGKTVSKRRGHLKHVDTYTLVTTHTRHMTLNR